MFDFSLPELGLVGIVALLVLGPKDMVIFLKSVSQAFGKVKGYYNDYVKYLNDAINEVEAEKNVVDMIMDMDGNMQRVYDLNKIMLQIKEEKDAANQ